jgi:hypothetical protein
MTQDAYADYINRILIRAKNGVPMAISAVSTFQFSANRMIAALGDSRLGSIRRNELRQAAGEAGTPRVDETKGLPEGKSELTEEEQAQVEKLRERDADVRRHEQAHKTAAGSYATGGPTYQYETGPDGKRYAVDGEVKIDTSEIKGDPAATLRKMRQVRQAASAPAEPSAKDRQVAAAAAAAERRAQAELAQKDADAAGQAAPALGRFIDVAA